MHTFNELWENGPVYAQAEHFKLGTDSVLLADFANTSSYKNGIDLGTGGGILCLLLLCKSSKLRMTGLEILPEAASVAELNIAENHLSERCGIMCGDIKNHRELFSSGEFDFVISNPPYFPQGSGYTSPQESRAGARGEESCTLSDMCKAASYLCRTGGAFFMVHRAERLAEIMCLLSENGLEPKRLRLVAHSQMHEPSLILIEARRGGKPGLKIMPTLILRNDDGTETDEVLKIYHREK